MRLFLTILYTPSLSMSFIVENNYIQGHRTRALPGNWDIYNALAIFDDVVFALDLPKQPSLAPIVLSVVEEQNSKNR